MASIRDTNGNDALFDSSGDGFLDARGGNDEVYARTRNDIVQGEAGIDQLYGGDGNDTIYIDGDDLVIQGTGDGHDTVFIDSRDNFDSGTGFNQVYAYQAGSGSLNVDLGQVQVESFVATNLNDIIGTSESVCIIVSGHGGNDTLQGDAGNDVLTGGNGDELISGGNDNNSVIGGAGANMMAGGLGADTYVVNDFNDLVTDLGGQGVDTIQTDMSHTLTANVENLAIMLYLTLVP